MSELRAVARAYAWPIAGVCLLTIAAVVTEAFGLLLFATLLNLWVSAGASLPSSGWLAAIEPHVRANPGLFFAVLGLTYIAKSGLSLWATYASISLALSIADRWRLRLFAGLLRVPTRAIPPRQGALLQLVIDEPAVAGAGLSASGILLQNVASALSVYVTLFWISVRVTLVLTMIGALASVVLLIMSRYSRLAAERRSSAYIEGYGYLTEILGALKQVRIFGLEPLAERRADALVSQMRVAQRRGNAIASSPRIVIELVFFGAAILTLALTSPRIGDPAVLSGAALAVVAAMRLLPAFSAAAGTWVQVHQAFPAVRRIVSELQRLEHVTDRRSDGQSSVAFNRSIECRGVTFAYPDRPPALRGVDLRIDVGTFVAIVGPSGSGKSTLLDLFCGLYDPDDGRIAVDDRDLRDVTKSVWRALLGVVPQDAFLLSGTLHENLCLLRPDCSDSLVREALEVSGADALIAELPAGLETRVGERGVALSGGQRQRLALARVLIREPRILLLDEATSALDPESDEAVFSRLERYRDRMTIVAVAHRLSSVRHADRIFVMQDGSVVESGTHESLLRSGGVYAGMWRAAERQPHERLEPRTVPVPSA